MDKIRQEDSARDTNRKWLLHVAETVLLKSPEVLRDLLANLEESVSQINREFGNDARRKIEQCDRTPRNGILIGRSHYPAVFLTVEPSLDNRRIEFQIARTRSRESETTEEDGYFGFTLDENNDLYLTYNGNVARIDEVARKLLEPFLS